MLRRSFSLAAMAVLGGFLGAAALQLVPGKAVAADPPAPAGEVRATRFILVDSVGKTLAVLGDYEPVYGKGDANPPAVKQMVGLVVYGGDGKPDVQIGRGGGVSRLEMRGTAGWMTTGVHPNGSGVGIWVPEDSLRFGLGFEADGNAGFVMKDRQGRDRFSGGMPPYVGMSMSLKGDDGETVWAAP